ncbi:MAG: glycosyltransferase family 2 protein [Planctomycetota bacterium]|nr:glycosyltransferase family 2 protein [Planctomycetota bacterium]MDA1105243.1 glycosyltransferase family 2 protein [Planctomycetota bacterium]
MILLAIPVYNEAGTIALVIHAVRAAGMEPTLFDDGSTDGSRGVATAAGATVVHAPRNRGYGATMKSILQHAQSHGATWVITMDCDEQHEPASLAAFLEAIRRDDADVISGTRYLSASLHDDLPPADRRHINAVMTAEINAALGLCISDAFCGFKAYRVAACAPLRLSCTGYEFPMEFWVRAARARLRITELPIRRIYTDAVRTFGQGLDDPDSRLAHYRQTMQRAMSEPCVPTGEPRPHRHAAARACGRHPTLPCSKSSD